jgi:hypothetical protein
VLDNAHRGEGAAVETAANRRSLVVHRATPLAQVNAGAVCALPEHQIAIGVPLSEQVRQALPVALLIYRDALVMAAR